MAVHLTTVDVDSDGHFRVTVTVPSDAASGAAAIRVAPAAEDATVAVAVSP